MMLFSGKVRGKAQMIWPGTQDRPGVAPGSPLPGTPEDAVVNQAGPPQFEPGDVPTVTPYLLEDGQVHPLVLVLPGGGYARQAAHEGEPVAQMLNAAGFHAAVLHYRVGPRHRHPAMVHDAQRAMRLLRQSADDWRISKGDDGQAKVGALGFSAGGHLTGSLAVHWDHFVCEVDDLATTHSARPDAVVLCYAVIDMTQHRHRGSFQLLLGSSPEQTLVEAMSLHTQVRDDSPPAFLWHTADDGGVPMQNSLLYFQACRDKQVRAELHVYESGHHGMSLAEKHATIRSWVPLAGEFLRRHLE